MKSVKCCSAFLFFAIAIMLSPAAANAQTVTTGGGLILDALFEIQTANALVKCAGPIEGKYLCGRTKAISSATLFISRSEDLKVLKVKLKSTKQASVKIKLKKKISALNIRIKSENALCAAGPDAPPTSPGTSPTATPTPRTTATPTPTGNFDSAGNVTASGKTNFGIPSNFNANTEAGRQVWTADCRGCHSSEKIGRSYSFYKSAVRASPMFITDQTDQNIADITAYLRRSELL